MTQDATMYLYENIGMAPPVTVPDGSITLYENIGFEQGQSTHDGQAYIYEDVQPVNRRDRAGAIVVRRRSM